MADKIFRIPLDIINSSYMSNDHSAIHRRSLSPESSTSAMESYTRHAVHALHAVLGDVPKRSGRIRLKSLLLSSAYTAASRAFLGSDFDALDTFGPFQEFDQSLSLITAGITNFTITRARESWQMVVAAIEQHLRAPHVLDDASELAKSTYATILGHGYVLNLHLVSKR
jgi:hypothetical protein